MSLVGLGTINSRLSALSPDKDAMRECIEQIEPGELKHYAIHHATTLLKTHEKRTEAAAKAAVKTRF